MTPAVVVDVGNTRLKWGWWPPGGNRLEMASLPHDDAAAWDAAVPRPGQLSWAVAGVNPAVLERWAKRDGYRIPEIGRVARLPES